MPPAMRAPARRFDPRPNSTSCCPTIDWCGPIARSTASCCGCSSGTTEPATSMRILHWFRKDLRLDDNTALAAAARDAEGDVVPFFARDDIAPTRIRHVLGALAELSASIAARGSRLALAHGDPADVLPRAARAA